MRTPEAARIAHVEAALFDHHDQHESFCDACCLATEVTRLRKKVEEYRSLYTMHYDGMGALGEVIKRHEVTIKELMTTIHELSARVGGSSPCPELKAGAGQSAPTIPRDLLRKNAPDFTDIDR